jgi:hypothetical protein
MRRSNELGDDHDRVSTPGWRWDYYVRITKSLVAVAAHAAGVE